MPGVLRNSRRQPGTGTNTCARHTNTQEGHQIQREILDERQTKRERERERESTPDLISVLSLLRPPRYNAKFATPGFFHLLFMSCSMGKGLLSSGRDYLVVRRRLAHSDIGSVFNKIFTNRDKERKKIILSRRWCKKAANQHHSNLECSYRGLGVYSLMTITSPYSTSVNKKKKAIRAAHSTCILLSSFVPQVMSQIIARLQGSSNLAKVTNRRRRAGLSTRARLCRRANGRPRCSIQACISSFWRHATYSSERHREHASALVRAISPADNRFCVQWDNWAYMSTGATLSHLILLLCDAT
jgi:hypothetical protein